jgi:hypothetical protein
MLYITGDEAPIGEAQAEELLSQEPKVIRHTRAWVDDSELCLEVECRLSDGTTISVTMTYCWDTPEFEGGRYFMEVTEWLLNNDWSSFYKFVQARFDAVLKEQAEADSSGYV